MDAVTAMIAISRMKARNVKYVPITALQLQGSGLKVHHRTVNQEGEPIFFFVDRLEYIKHLEQKNQLFKKRQSLRDVLRNSLRK